MASKRKKDSADPLLSEKPEKGDRDRYERALDSALRFKAHTGAEECWKRYVKRLAHIYYDGVAEDDRPTINIMAARIRALVPQLAIGMPVAKVESVFNPANMNSENVLAKRLTNVWAYGKMDEVTRSITLDAETAGLGIGFVGYESKFEEVQVGVEQETPGIVQGIAGALGPLGGIMDPFVEQFTQEVPVTEQQLRYEQAFLERVSPFDFVFDPTASHLGRCSYMGRRLFLTQKEAKEWFGSDAPRGDSSGNVAEWEKRDTWGAQSSAEPSAISSIIDPSVKRCIVWELYFFEDKKVVYYDRDCKVIKARDWPSVSENPFVFMIWDEVPDRVLPEGLAASIEPLQNELHLTRKRQIQFQRMAIGKMLSRGPLTRQARRALMSDNDREIVELDENTEVEWMSNATIPNDMYSLENRIKEDLNEASNTTPGQALATGNIRKTATESAFIQNAADAVVAFRQLMVERFAMGVLERILDIETHLCDQVLPLKIINADPMLMDYRSGAFIPVGQTIEFQYVGIEHAGQYVVTVDQGSMVASANDVERMSLLEVYKIGSTEPWFNKKAALSKIISLMPSIHDASAFIISDEQMQQQQAQQAQQQSVNGSNPSVNGMMPQQMQGQMPAQQTSGAMDYGMTNPTAEGDLLSALYGGMAPQGM